jgi:FkbM family methyltransferase
MNNIFNLPNDIVIYGIGFYGASCLEYINDNFDTQVKYIIDNKLCLEINDYNGIPIISYQDYLDLKLELFIVITIRSGNTIELDEIVKSTINYIYFDQLFILNNYKNLNKVANLFIDNESKILFSSILGKRSSFIGRVEEVLIKGDQYFCLPDFQRRTNQLFIDCGAYVGDTFEKWLQINEGNIGGYIGIDPFIEHKRLFQNRLKRLSTEYILDESNINFLVAFASNCHTSTKINHNLKNKSRTSLTRNDINTFGKELSSVEIIKIDDLAIKYLKNYKSIFIKMDIEGSEFKALLGAEKIIKRYKPLLAISIYHRIDDLIRIPLLINKFSNKYKLYLRHHSPTLDETVLYCIHD